MTLKISHGAFAGMCSEFHSWRCDIARAAGYRTEVTCDGETIVLDLDAITANNIAGSWRTPPADALLVLLAHSDVAGVISPSDSLRLADRLAELLIPLKWRTVTAKFIAACRVAVFRNEQMEFEWDPAAMMQGTLTEVLRQRFDATASGRQVTGSMGHGSTMH
jgi:hypothetical protein